MKAILKFRYFLLLVVVGTFLTVVSSSCKNDDPVVPPPPNVVQLAQSDTTLSLLVKLVIATQLTDYLSSTNNITVFAPTNAAFRKAGLTDAIVNGLNTTTGSAYVDVLKYHVLALGNKITADLVPVSDAVVTVNTKKLFASKNPNGVFVNGIKVTTPNLDATNGVVHKIDGVLFPPTKTIAELVVERTSLSTLLAALQYADNMAPGLVAALSAPGKFTVFAPDNTAFNTSGITSLSGFTPAQVKALIQAHVIGTNVFSSDLIAGGTAPTLNNTTASPQTLTITIPAAVKLTTGGTNTLASNITTPDIIATNGVVHIIDRVIR